MGLHLKKDTQKYIFVVFSVLLLCGMFVAVKTVYGNEQDQINTGRLLYRTFSSSQVKVEKMGLQHSGFFKENQSLEEILSMKKELERTFSLSLQQVTKVDHGEHLIKFQGKKMLPNNQMLRLVWGGEKDNTGTDESRYRTFIVAELIGQVKDEQHLVNSFQQLFNLLLSVDIKPVINVSFKGIYPDRQEVSKQKTLIRSLLNKFNGSIVEGIDGDSGVSVTGYSEKLSRFVNSREQKVNVQINTHLNSNGENTIVFIGSPIIILD